MKNKNMKNEICEKEGHQFRILKYWYKGGKIEVSSTDSTSSTGFFTEPQTWYVLMTCLKCGKTIIKEAIFEKNENKKEKEE